MLTRENFDDARKLKLTKYEAENDQKLARKSIVIFFPN